MLTLPPEPELPEELQSVRREESEVSQWEVSDCNTVCRAEPK